MNAAPEPARITQWRTLTMGTLLGVGLGWACAPEPALGECTDQVGGSVEDWRSEAPVPAPECEASPPEPLALCIRPEASELTEDQIRTLQLDAPGVITGLGMGAPPVDCFGLESVGSLYDDDGELIPPAEDLRWIRVELDGEPWVIAMAAPGNGTALAIGDQVQVRVDWERVPFYVHARFELRDVDGDTLWWMIADVGNTTVDEPPHCMPMRLGAAQCHGSGQCWKTQHHAAEIAGISVPPGQQVVIDDLRLTNGASAVYYDDTCTDVPAGWRMLAATRED